MKKMIVLMLICCMFTACGASEEPNVTEQQETVEDAAEEEAAEETAEEAAEGVTISPLPATLDEETMNNATMAVSFEEGDAYVDDTGKMQLDVTVYTYDLYDMVDIANLKEGDNIVIREENVAVDSVERLETGLVLINGGIEMGGYDLWHNDSGVYFESGMNDAKSYYEVAQKTFRVSADFQFVDESDPEQEATTYFPGDFLTDEAGIVYDFTPNNTSIVVEDGQVIQMTRIFTP